MVREVMPVLRVVQEAVWWVTLEDQAKAAAVKVAPRAQAEIPDTQTVAPRRLLGILEPEVQAALAGTLEAVAEAAAGMAAAVAVPTTTPVVQMQAVGAEVPPMPPPNTPTASSIKEESAPAMA